MTFHFEIIHKSKISKARVGRIFTPHGVIDTPNFVPVGTQAAVKALDSQILSEMNLQLIFCNTYHLLLYPGLDTVQKAEGLHNFMNRSLPIITDSGGFQVFSLAYGSVADELKGRGQKKQEDHIVKITEEGVLFRSYRDGKKVLLTPESSIEAQKIFGADIILPFDELPPYHIGKKDLTSSFERTHRWEKRSLHAHVKNKKGQAMYAIVHGGVDEELRKKSCETLQKLAFDGFAIGGSVGKNALEMEKMLAFTVPEISENFPKHLLGIGDPGSIEMVVKYGIDTMDSSYPTKAARHGMLFTKNQKIKITASKYRDDFSKIEEGCECFCCQHYTKSYLHHLFQAHELLSYRLATIHNLFFMNEKMKKIREAICQNQL